MKMKKLFLFPAYCPGKDTLRSRRSACLLACLICGAVLFSIPLSAGTALAHEAEPHPHAEDSEVGDTKYKDPDHGSLGEVGAKLANPLANLWALSMSFNMPQFYDGDVNTGDPELGATLLFQPVMPIPLMEPGRINGGSSRAQSFRSFSASPFRKMKRGLRYIPPEALSFSEDPYRK